MHTYACVPLHVCVYIYVNIHTQRKRICPISPLPKFKSCWRDHNFGAWQVEHMSYEYSCLHAGLCSEVCHRWRAWALALAWNIPGILHYPSTDDPYEIQYQRRWPIRQSDFGDKSESISCCHCVSPLDTFLGDLKSNHHELVNLWNWSFLEPTSVPVTLLPLLPKVLLHLLLGAQSQCSFSFCTQEGEVGREWQAWWLCGLAALCKRTCLAPNPAMFSGLDD